MTSHYNIAIDPKSTNRTMYEFFIEKLREAVARKYGKRLSTSHDFINLSNEMSDCLRDTLGASTLKRIWDYIEPHRHARQSSLDVLARYVGYRDFSTLCQNIGASAADESGFFSARILYTKDVSEEQLIEIQWMPDRRITVKRSGDSSFVVVSSDNSRLLSGSVMSIPYLIEGRPMVSDVILPGHSVPMVYEAGRDGGIRWTVIDSM